MRWSRSLRPSLRTLALLSFLFVEPGSAAGQSVSGFVTRIGKDTLVAEHVVRDGGTLTVEVLQRSPRVTFARYVVGLDGDNRIRSYEAQLWDGAKAAGEPDRTERLETDGSGEWSYTVIRNGQAETRAVQAPADAVPFIDQVHWPFDVALQRHAARGDGEADLPMLSGGRAMTYGIVRMDDGSWGLRHPSRGTSAIETDSQGRLVALNGYGTTRALILERTAGVDMAAMGELFAARGPMGELSGRAETLADVDGAEITIDYGVPMKRNREIFGALVAYGQVWRTGANQATHFTTTRDLVVGEEGLVVPAGTYTLFSIPEADHLTLMINTRTNINGQSYRADADLGSVRMRRESVDDVVEPFTIAVEDTPAGGTLSLIWDRTAYRVDFTVRQPAEEDSR